VDCGRTLDGALGRVHGAFLVAIDLTRLLLVLPLLQPGAEDLGQVRVLDVRPVGRVDRLLDLPLLQEPGRIGGELAVLVSLLLAGPAPIDYDRDRLHGNDEELDDYAPRHASHVLEHGPYIELHCASSWA